MSNLATTLVLIIKNASNLLLEKKVSIRTDVTCTELTNAPSKTHRNGNLIFILDLKVWSRKSQLQSLHQKNQDTKSQSFHQCLHKLMIRSKNQKLLLFNQRETQLRLLLQRLKFTSSCKSSKRNRSISKGRN